MTFWDSVVVYSSEISHLHFSGSISRYLSSYFNWRIDVLRHSTRSLSFKRKHSLHLCLRSSEKSMFWASIVFSGFNKIFTASLEAPKKVCFELRSWFQVSTSYLQLLYAQHCELQSKLFWIFTEWEGIRNFILGFPAPEAFQLYRPKNGRKKRFWFSFRERANGREWRQRDARFTYRSDGRRRGCEFGSWKCKKINRQTIQCCNEKSSNKQASVKALHYSQNVLCIARVDGQIRSHYTGFAILAFHCFQNPKGR